MWVDFSFTGVQEGTFTNPVNTLFNANAMVPPNGEVRILQGTTPEVVTLDRSAIYRAVGGVVRAGALP